MKASRNTREKDRQSQVLCVFALVRVLARGWQTVPEIRAALAASGFPRCEKTIRRLFRTLQGADIELLVDRRGSPCRFRVRKTTPFRRKEGRS